MGEAAQRQPWERRADEPMRCFRRFLKYRNLGPERSVRKACDIVKLPQKGRKPSWQYWRTLAAQWHWNDRARAWDEYQEYERRKAELAAEAKAREDHAADHILQQELLSQEAIALRTIARLLAGQILAVLKDPRQLAEMKLRRVKVVDGDKFNRTEMTTPGILDLVKLVGDGLKIGSELYRVAQLDQPGDDGKPKTAERKAQELANILAGKLLGMDIGGLLALREELIGLDGKPGEAR